MGMSPLVRMIIRRLLLGAMTLVVVSAIIFFSVELLPGDFARAILGQNATEEAVQALREALGLNKPAVVRYFEWLGGALQGDFGLSFSGRTADGGRPVAAILLPRLGNTFLLALLAALVAVPSAIALGLLAARYRGHWPDKIITFMALVFVAMPEFLIGYVLITWLAVKWRLLPSLATLDPARPLLEQAERLILPTLTLSFVVTAHILRMTRASVVETFGKPWMEMAVLKGLPPRYRLLHHALPNTAGPLANIVAFNLAWLITGVVVTETVFVYPGAGRLMVDAVAARDIPVVQACALVFAAVYIGLNLLADIVTILANPRLRTEAAT